jgi:peptidoglycan/LPS O-acetylase OafA/YrhL
LHPLDGIRAIAIIWVYALHTGMNLGGSGFNKCIEEGNPFFIWFFRTSLNGDMGVDLFFVLSGFLIAFILMKEIDKFGEIDFWFFMQGRFIRLLPAVIFFLALFTPLLLTKGSPW